MEAKLHHHDLHPVSTPEKFLSFLNDDLFICLLKGNFGFGMELAAIMNSPRSKLRGIRSASLCFADNKDLF